MSLLVLPKELRLVAEEGVVAEEGIVAEEVVVAEEEVALDCEAMSWQLHVGKYVGGKPQGEGSIR